MKNLTWLAYVIALLSTIDVDASPLKGKFKINVNNSDQKCLDVKLYREMSEGQRITILTPVNDLLYLSKDYCFVYWPDESPPELKNSLLKYNFYESRDLGIRYSLTYEKLSSDEQRIAFAHLFLKSLTERSVVLPATSNINEIRYVLPTHKQGKKTFRALSLLSSDNDYQLLHNGLLALADKPPIDKDWPELVKLVELVLTNLNSTSAQTIDMWDELAKRKIP